MTEEAKKLEIVQQSTAASVAPSETSAVLSMIERVARDPTVDIDRLERLLEMQERIIARTAKASFQEALSAMQPKLPSITARGKIEIRAKDTKGERTGDVQQSTPYARFEDINDAIRPVLAEHGFALSFRTGLSADGRITVTGILSHGGGHQEETMMTLPHDSTGSKNAVQAIGSSTSYGKRYVTMALLNLTSRLPVDADDDGKAGGGSGPINDEQLATIQSLIVEVAADIPKFCKYMKVAKIEEIPEKQYKRAIEALNAKKAKPTKEKS